MKKSFLTLAALFVCLALPGVTLAQQQDVPLTVTVEGTPGNAGGLKIVSDGKRPPSGQNAGSYTDGLDGVYAVFSAGNNGMLIFDPAYRSAKTPRSLWYNFSDKIAAGPIANPWAGKGLTQIGSRIQIGNMYSVPLTSDDPAQGPSYVLRVGVFQQMFYGNSKTNYRVSFRPTVNAGESPDGFTYAGNPVENYPYAASAYEVRHPDCNTWVVTPRAVSYTFMDAAGNQITNSGAIATLIGFNNTMPPTSAGQHLMPFRITLRRVAPVATCQ